MNNSYRHYWLRMRKDEDDFVWKTDVFADRETILKIKNKYLDSGYFSWKLCEGCSFCLQVEIKEKQSFISDY